MAYTPLSGSDTIRIEIGLESKWINGRWTVSHLQHVGLSFLLSHVQLTNEYK